MIRILIIVLRGEMWGKNKQNLPPRYLRERFLYSGINPLQGFFPTSAGHHQVEANWHSAGADAFFCTPLSLTKTSFRRSFGIQKNRTTKGCAICFFCDSVGIRTQDPQLRRLLLYPAELPNQSLALFRKRLQR